jgi:hypothetical protein
MGFSKDLEIDHNALDVEWLGQPKKFFEVSEELASAREMLDQMKFALEVAEAEVDQDIRANPSAHGLEKVTETAVKAAVVLDSRYEKARKDYIHAKHEADVLAAAVSAFEQRKRALEHLVTLHGQQYFAGPKAPRDLDGEVLREAEKRAARSKARKKARQEDVPTARVHKRGKKKGD